VSQGCLPFKLNVNAYSITILLCSEMQVIRVKDWRDKAGATAEMFNYTAQHGINPQYLK
jgi:hypothetical protein